jgi:hypothetical protein
MSLKREDELDPEEEAMELEPLFSRGKPIPVSRPAPKAVYRADLEDDLRRTLRSWNFSSQQEAREECHGRRRRLAARQTHNTL